MNDFNAIDDSLYDWVALYAGIAIIWAEDNGVKPDLPYITLRRSTLTGIGHEFISSPDDNGKAKISGDRDMVLNFQCFGSNAFGRLEDLWSVRLIPASQEMLIASGLSLIDKYVLTNLTGLNDTEFEERAQMDLLFRFASQRTNVDVGLIEESNIEGTYKDEKQDTVLTQTFNVKK